MIQRIQSLWLLAAVLLNSALFVTNLYVSDTQTQVTVKGHYPLLVAAMVIIIIPLIAIFLFKNRKKQRNVIVGAIIAHASFISLMLMKINTYNISTPAPVNGQYSIGAVLPILSIVCLVLAIRGVIKDDKLVKSTDRLR